LENDSKPEQAKLEITTEQFEDHRRHYPVPNPHAADILTDEIEIRLWNRFLNSNDPSIVQDALKLAKAYGLRATKMDSDR
jgi:hypothetical protein